MPARELTTVVVMGGEVYGPGYINPPPDAVAQAITNPACWGEVVSNSDAAPPQGAEPVQPPAITPAAPATPTEPAAPAPPSTAPTPTNPVPPRSGAGSGIVAWRAFADDNEVSYPEDATRDEIIEACKLAKVI